jgi:hypothetical protein
VTLDELMNAASEACVETRESFLVMFTHGLNGYVCKNEGAMDESRALYRGTYRDCQIWVERRGISAALAHINEHRSEVPELAGSTLVLTELLLRLAHQ